MVCPLGAGRTVLLLCPLVAGKREGLVKLLQQVHQRQAGGCLERLVVLEQREPHHQVRKHLAATGIRDFLDISHQPRNVQELRHGCPLVVFLVDHECGPDAAVRMAAATDLAPLGLRAVDQVGEVREGAHQRDWEPVARRLGDPKLLFDVQRHMGERVALAQTPFRRDVFIAPGKRDRLEGDKGDLPRVLPGEADDRPHLVVVDSVHECRHEDDLDARLVHVLDGPELHVEQIAHLSVAVGVVPDAVELQVGIAQTGFGGFAAEFGALGELDAVGGRLDAVIPELARVADRINEVG